MCQDNSFEESPAITIGGATGDYFVIAPIVNGRWAEYCIDTIVNGDGGTGAIVVSGNTIPKALDYTGIAANKMSNDAFLKGVPYRIPATTTQQMNSSWERITNSEKKVFIRIDAASSTSMFVTLRFRSKVLGTVPGPSHEVHPDYMQEMNKARAETTKQRLKDMGIPAYAEEISGARTNRDASNSDERNAPTSSITR
jgi:hypothetical protein